LSNPRIIQNNGQRLYLKLVQGSGTGINQLTGDVLAGPGIGSQLATLLGVNSNVGTFGDSTHVPQFVVDAKGRILSVGNVAITGGGGSVATSMPIASTLSVLDNGSDMTTILNGIFTNAAYSGIIIDFSNPGAVTINGSVNCQGKTVRFAPGNRFTGTGRIYNHIHDSGLRQWCYDIGSSGAPALTVDPIGTTLSVISPWAFGMKDDGSDSSRALQATIDSCIRNGSKVSKIIIPTGTYTFSHGILEFLWNGSNYVSHMVTIDCETNFSEASGFGSVFDFTAVRNSFSLGIQAGKGSTINNIKIESGFVPPTVTTAYSFYTQNISSYTDGVSRDSQYSPHCGIVVDPFGPSVPSDGGYPGTDAYGNNWSTYYRGSSNGSTGVELENVFCYGYVVGLITSPSGGTVNAELLYARGLQFANYKWCVSGCQTQEKGNVVEFCQAWGEGYGIWTNNSYGNQAAGNWTLRYWNIAGYNVLFGSHNDSGYTPCFFQNIVAESIGSMGTMKTDQGSSFSDCQWNFVPYGSAGCYLSGQVKTTGFTHIGGSMKMYGTFHPITIDDSIGAIFFKDVSFETAPFFTTGYTRGNSSFKNCTVSGDIINPDDLQTVLSSSFSNTFSYGNVRINSGGRIYSISGSYPAMPLPLNRVSANYVVTIGLSGGYYQASISVPADEANRVFVGDTICASATAGGVLKILGTVLSIVGGTMVVQYINLSAFTSGNSYYLYVWLPLYNISFTGDITNTSNQISNVSVKDGTLSYLIGLGGLMLTKSIPVSDTFLSNLIRVTAYNSGTNIITLDKNATASTAKLLFTNTDAKPDPGTPSIVAGAAAGSGPTLSITKGNDKSMQVSFTQGSTPITGVLATVSFSLPFPGGYIPSIRFSPANSASAALNGATQIWMDAANTNSFTINTGSSALSNGVTYIWNIEAN
jgi:hypothetical protein